MTELPITPSISLRSVEAADESLLLDLYRSTREQELALVPWTEEQKNSFVRMQFIAQRAHYEAANPEAEHFIVIYQSEAVGRLWIVNSANQIKILDLTVAPAQRNKGIGEQLMTFLLAEAGKKRKSVEVFVETFNPSQSFFGRLGFHAVETQGIHALLRWTPDNNDR